MCITFMRSVARCLSKEVGIGSRSHILLWEAWLKVGPVISASVASSNRLKGAAEGYCSLNFSIK